MACATGNTARVYRLNRGLIAEGREADLVVCDAPIGSVAGDALAALTAGDLPGISMVLVDGKITDRPQPQHAARRARGRGRQGTRARAARATEPCASKPFRGYRFGIDRGRDLTRSWPRPTIRSARPSRSASTR